MKLLRQSSLSAAALVAASLAITISIPAASAFAPLRASSSSFRNRPRKRRTAPPPLSSSRHREDVEDQFSSIRNSWSDLRTRDTEGNLVWKSDVPSSSGSSEHGFPEVAERFRDEILKRVVPPPPEDQFIMTGDIAILFLYAFTSHSINDAVVRGLLDDPAMTIPEAVKELDPLHDMVNLQHPVWVDLASNPNVPFGNPAVDHALEVSARESLLNHWGPLLSTEGSACVALCTCWLIAGYFHRAFCYDYSLYCSPARALTKTVETWVTAAVLMACFATGTDWLVGHVPALQSIFCVTCNRNEAVTFASAVAAAASPESTAAAASGGDNVLLLPLVLWKSLTQSDVLFIIDSLTVLIAWRWSAHRILNTFR